MKSLELKRGAITALFLCLVGCSTVEPLPFKTGKEVAPLPGCVDLRERGGRC